MELRSVWFWLDILITTHALHRSGLTELFFLFNNIIFIFSTCPISCLQIFSKHGARMISGSPGHMAQWRWCQKLQGITHYYMGHFTRLGYRPIMPTLRNKQHSFALVVIFCQNIFVLYWSTYRKLLYDTKFVYLWQYFHGIFFTEMWKKY